MRSRQHGRGSRCGSKNDTRFFSPVYVTWTPCVRQRMNIETFRKVADCGDIAIAGQLL